MKKIMLALLALVIFAAGAFGIIYLGQRHIGEPLSSFSNSTTVNSTTSSTPTGSSSATTKTVKTTSTTQKSATALKQIGAGKTLSYAALGDSIASGNYANNRKSAYQYLVASDLQSQLGFNVSLTGQWAVGGTVKGTALSAISHIIANKPDLVTLQFGNSEQDDSSVYHATVNEYVTNLTSVIAQIKNQSPTTKIIVLGTWKSAAAKKYSNAARAVASSTKSAFVDLSNVWKTTGAIPKTGTLTNDGTADGILPGDTGNKLIAKAIMKSAIELYSK